MLFAVAVSTIRKSASFASIFPKCPSRGPRALELDNDTRERHAGALDPDKSLGAAPEEPGAVPVEQWKRLQCPRVAPVEPETAQMHWGL